MLFTDYIKSYGVVKIKDREYNKFFLSDGINTLTGGFKVKNLKKHGMF